MQFRVLGTSGVKVSAIGLGCMGMSEFYGDHNDADSVRVIHRALDLGVSFLDTADIYGVGNNEVLVGKAVRGRRDRAFIATKFGNVRGKDGTFLGVNGCPDYVQNACESSLMRLKIDHIDLYYQHRVDPNIPIEETVGAMKNLVSQGKVKYLGLSEASPDTIRRAAAIHPIAALQTEYSLWTRDVEREHLKTCRKLGIALIPYSPLGRGFLSGKIRSLEDLEEGDWRRSNPRFQGDNFQKNLDLLAVVEAIAKEKGCTPSQVALQWVLMQGEDVIPIPGTKRIQYLEENVDAVDVVLTPEDRKRLDAAFPPNAAAGTRYPEWAMKFLDG